MACCTPPPQVGFPKALHVTHACPLTDMHSACDYPSWAAHDCLCKSLPPTDPVADKGAHGCVLMHLSTSTSPRQMHLRWEHWRGQPVAWRQARSELSELSLLARAASKPP